MQDDIEKNRIDKQFLLIPLLVVLFVAVSVLTYVSYSKYISSKTNLVGLNSTSNFFADMENIENIYNSTEQNAAKFNEKILKTNNISAWVLRPADEGVLVIASTKSNNLVGQRLPNYVCDIDKILPLIIERGRYSSVSFGHNSLIEICDFKIIKDVIIGYNSKASYTVSGIDDPNFAKWYFGNMKLTLSMLVFGLAVYMFMYYIFYRKINSSHENLQILNNQLLENSNQITKSYYYNALTNLPNYNSLLKDIEGMKRPVVIVIDVDSFSSMNNYFGTRICDQVLIYLSNFNRELANKSGLSLYHTGADTFAFLEDCEFDIDRYEDLVTELIDALKGLVIDIPRLENERQDSIEVHCTIGFALEHENTIKKAMLALNYAKQNKRDYFCYLKSIDDTIAYADQIKRSNIIRDAIINDTITPYYQPIFDVNKKIVKYETLMRIQDNSTTISPGIFLEVSKHIKRYVTMEKMLIEKSLKLLSQTQNVVITINLSARDMTDGDVSVFILNELNKYQVADRVVFEVLEDEDISSVDRVMKFIDRVKRMGVKIAIDDFGSGYSNFSNILKLKPDFIKIDGSIIKNVVSDLDSRYITTAIVAFCKKLNIKVVAEYVEDQAIFETCAELGIDEFQGFYLGKPSSSFVSEADI